MTVAPESLQDTLYNYPKLQLQLLDHHLPFPAYHQQIMMNWRLGGEMPSTRQIFCFSKIYSITYTKPKHRQNTTSLVHHCSDLRAPGSRELQMTQGKGKTGWDQRSMKHCAVLLHFCCSRTTAIRGITRKQPFWGVSLLNNWKTNVHGAQWQSWKSSPKLPMCSLPGCQWHEKWTMWME